jgi:2-polyprenyl-3-methyl-5-hydroxy-6-metoxy-1,4-benzoquinol methylase
VQSVEDHAGLEYWDRNWQRQPLPELWDVDGHLLRDYVDRALFRYMSDALSAHGVSGSKKSLVEVGCASSAVLPLFSSKLGFLISGVDYSPTGCAQTEAILAREGIDGAVFQSDVFAPPEDLLGRFDVGVSVGLVEHFSDTGSVVRALADLLKPGGVMITSVPNMNGATGFTQKILDPAVYDIHVPLTREQLRDAHVSAGLKIEQCDYFLPSNFGVCNLNKSSKQTLSWKLKRISLAALRRLSMLSWWLELHIGRLPVSRLFSPYVNCISVKSI